jgi:release factor glutamine methyltransferase
VYPPQQDSLLLIEVMHRLDVGTKTVADMCTGSGIVAIAAAHAGAARVDAFDVSTAAVACARQNAAAAHAAITVHHGSLDRAAAMGPYDVVLCNPPYVPFSAAEAVDEAIGADAGPPQAWNAGLDGRLVLDPLCVMAPRLLTAGGTLLLVHSETADIERSLTSLAAGDLHADVAVRQRIPFGPVMSARSSWLKRTGRLAADRHDEELVVIRARKR